MTAASVLDVTDLRDLLATERDSALAAISASLEGKRAEEIAAWVASVFGTDVIVAASMQDLVLPHLFAQVIPGIEVLFLQTGYHFPETLLTRDLAARALPITLVQALPRQSVSEQGGEYGEKLHGRDPNLCCFLRKVEPLARSLEGRAAWVTGVRRIEAPTRANTPIVSWDERHGLVKINPLVTWSDEDVEAYQVEHDLPCNPLVAQGYPSIGCAPCTRKVAPGEDPRAGRWSGNDKTECGIHT
ncbi:MAG: phosphoadenylyl-sulfate reductase [Dermatophilaceae bacterium]